jgi:hypothetical protein
VPGLRVVKLRSSNSSLKNRKFVVENLISEALGIFSARRALPADVCSIPCEIKYIEDIDKNRVCNKRLGRGIALYKMSEARD